MMVSWQTEVDLREKDILIEDCSAAGSNPEETMDEVAETSPLKSILKASSVCPFKDCFGRTVKKVKIHCEQEQTDL